MYIATIPNRNSPPAILLREGYREDGQVKTRTLANLSTWPPEAIAVLRQVLQGKQMVPADELFEIVENGSRAHGLAEAVLTTMRRLGFFQLINPRPSRERDLVVAMVAARILKPQSKLATTRWWLSTTLACKATVTPDLSPRWIASSRSRIGPIPEAQPPPGRSGLSIPRKSPTSPGGGRVIPPG